MLRFTLGDSPANVAYVRLVYLAMFACCTLTKLLPFCSSIGQLASTFAPLELWWTSSWLIAYLFRSLSFIGQLAPHFVPHARDYEGQAASSLASVAFGSRKIILNYFT